MGKIKNRKFYQKMKARKKQSDVLGKVVSYLLLSIGSLIMTVPFLWMVITSLKQRDAIFTFSSELIPRSTYTTLDFSANDDRELKIYSIETNGQKFVEIHSQKITQPIIYYEVRQIVAQKHEVAKFRLLDKGNNFENNIEVDMTSLEPTQEFEQYLDKSYKVFQFKEKVGVYPKGLKGIVVEKNFKDFKILPKSYVITNEITITKDRVVENGINKSIVKAKHPKINKGNAFLGVIVEEIVYKPAKWATIIKYVKESSLKKATIRYYDATYEELSEIEKLIVFKKDELKKINMDHYRNLEGVKKLYVLSKQPDKPFAIVSQDNLKYEPYGKEITGIEKYRQEKQHHTFADGSTIEVFKNIPRFIEIKYINFVWENYYKALFTVIPSIKSSDVEGLTFLTILINLFGEIPAFIVYFINSIVVSLTITFAELATSCLAAYAFARLNWKGRDKIFLLYLSTMMIPGQVTIIPVYIIIKELNWIDTYKALIIPQAFSAWSVFMLRQFFLSIPKTLEEAAYLDGCSRAGILFKVILPLSKAALGTLFIFRFQAAYNEFIWPLIVTNSDHMKVVQIGLSAFHQQHFTDWSLLMAASVIVITPVLLIYIFNQKYISDGIKLGGTIKG